MFLNFIITHNKKFKFIFKNIYILNLIYTKLVYRYYLYNYDIVMLKIELIRLTKKINKNIYNLSRYKYLHSKL